MQTIEITTSPNVVCITVERAALNSDMLTHITNTLQGLIVADGMPASRSLTASELRRLPLHEREIILAAQTQIALQDYQNIHGGEELSESEEV